MYVEYLIKCDFVSIGRLNYVLGFLGFFQQMQENLVFPEIWCTVRQYMYADGWCTIA